MGETDRRSVRTRNAIKNAMIELLKKKDITKITVSEITERADIGRGTFYLHYSDPYDLLDQIENEAINQITTPDSPVTDTWRYTHLLTHLEHVWQYIYENQDVFKILMNHQDGARFLKKFKRYCENAAFTAANIDKFARTDELYGITYVISGTLGMFQKWMEEDTVIPPGQLAQIARNAIGVNSGR